MTQFLGTAASEVLKGGRDDDYLNGGGGDDILTGGKGHDAFGMSLGGGLDVITDFGHAYSNRWGYTDHDTFVFDGYGPFVPEEMGPFAQLWPGALYDGQQFHTVDGHVLTVTDLGADVSLTMEDGAGFVVQGVEPGELRAEWIASLDSYGWVF